MTSNKDESEEPRKRRNGKVQHVVPSKNQWAVCSAGSTSPTNTYDTQAEAIEVAKVIAKGNDSDVVIHSRDGRMTHRVSVSHADELMLEFWRDAHQGESKLKAE